MNKLSRMVMVFLPLAAVSVPASAVFLQDWYFDPDGPTGPRQPVLINNTLDFNGVSFVQTTLPPPPTFPPSGTTFTFSDNGTFNFQAYDGGTPLLTGGTLSDGVTPNPASNAEVTGILQNTHGTGIISGNASNVTFSDGVMKIYSDTHNNYAANTTGAGIFYGASDGTLIGTFAVLPGGGGSIDAGSALPNGYLNILGTATQMAPGYFFMSDGATDLSDWVDTGLVLGFVGSNAMPIANPSNNVKTQIVQKMADYNPANLNFNKAPNNFVVTNGGSLQLDVLSVPEPGAAALVGLGLAGLGLRRFRRA